MKQIIIVEETLENLSSSDVPADEDNNHVYILCDEGKKYLLRQAAIKKRGWPVGENVALNGYIWCPLDVSRPIDSEIIEGLCGSIALTLSSKPAAKIYQLTENEFRDFCARGYTLPET